jgi:membrane protease YdiL (CAAX protease family)
MNWLYYKTNRNILVAVVLHMGANVFNEIFATHPDSKVIQTGLLCVLTVYLLVKDREFFFDRAYDEAEVANL